MIKSINNAQKSAPQRFPICLGLLLLACTTLLSACNGIGSASTNASNGQTNMPALTPSPTVSASLQQEGSMQLQAFQQWITLMKQYDGQVNQYQQQYSNDQQALNIASADNT